MDSWADSQNAMIVCDEVPENTPASRGSDLTGEAVSDPLGRLSENLAAAARPTDGAEHQCWEETTSWAVRAPGCCCQLSFRQHRVTRSDWVGS